MACICVSMCSPKSGVSEFISPCIKDGTFYQRAVFSMFLELNFYGYDACFGGARPHDADFF